MEIEKDLIQKVEAPGLKFIENSQKISKLKISRKRKRKEKGTKQYTFICFYSYFPAPYLHFTSKKSEAIAFLGEVKKQFKEGNIPLYKAAIDNLEKFYELEKNGDKEVSHM